MKYCCKIQSKENIHPDINKPWTEWRVEYYPVSELHKPIVETTSRLNIQIIDMPVGSDKIAYYTFKGNRKTIRTFISVLIMTFGDKYYFEKI